MSAAPALGEMRSRVALERPDDAVDDTGSLTRVWTQVADLWARITPLRGAEGFVAGQQETSILYDVTIRWRPDAASPMRFRIGSRALYIRTAFDPDARRRSLVCRCEEYVA
jgi:SPP1 family predicted phage head-tail adaptor